MTQLYSKCISMIIAKTGRNVAFKSVKLTMFTSEADILTRQVVTEGLSFNYSEADFQDLGHNSNLYIFNQDDRQE